MLALIAGRLRQLAAGPARFALSSVVALTLACVAVFAYVALTRVEARRVTYSVANDGPAPTTMNEEGVGPDGPFFPSSATTSTGGIVESSFFLTSEGCGRCHKDIYEQWRSSAHHLASFNNQWYRKSIEYMQDVVGTKPSKWCAVCHDHAVLFSGRFDQPIKDQIDTPEAQAGLACVSCHAISHVKSTMGSLRRTRSSGAGVDRVRG